MNPLARIVRHAAITAIVAVSSGCATYSIQFPEFKNEVKIAISDADLSRHTEMPAGAHLIPDSHVWLFGKTGATMTGAALLGPLGVMIGAEIDRSRNATLLGDSGETALRRRLDAPLRASLERTTAAPGSLAIRLVDDPERADVTLLPTAMLRLLDSGKLDLTFRVQVRARSTDGAPPARRFYFYGDAPARETSGDQTWWADGGKAFKAAEGRALLVLASIIVRDLRGEFKPRTSADPFEVVDWLPIADRTAGVSSGLLLEDAPDHIVVNPLFRDRPMRPLVAIWGKALVEPQGTRRMAVADLP